MYNGQVSIPMNALLVCYLPLFRAVRDVFMDPDTARHDSPGE